MVNYINQAIILLKHSNNFAADFVNLRMEWFRLFAKGRVCSTNAGADFFIVCRRALESQSYEYANSQYDKNFALILSEYGVTIKPKPEE